MFFYTLIEYTSFLLSSKIHYLELCMILQMHNKMHYRKNNQKLPLSSSKTEYIKLYSHVFSPFVILMIYKISFLIIQISCDSHRQIFTFTWIFICNFSFDCEFSCFLSKNNKIISQYIYCLLFLQNDAMYIFFSSSNHFQQLFHS
jgi:hypothetical protein